MTARRTGLTFGTTLVVLVLVVCLASPVAAFGAGNIPSYSFLEGKAFRHGDIEDILAELIKKSGGILGRGSKFGGLDIKRVYFGEHTVGSFENRLIHEVELTGLGLCR